MSWVLCRTFERVALAFVIIVATAFAFSGYYRWTWDAFSHMFFADHYARSWFDMWEPRWYGGFSVSAYPPLAHQCMALLSSLVSLETSFVLVMWGSVIGVSLAVASYARLFVGDALAPWVAIMVACWPATSRTAYIHGQVAHMLAAGLVFVSLVFVHRYLRGGRPWDAACMVLGMGAVVATHHVSSILLGGGVALALLIEAPLQRVVEESPMRRRVVFVVTAFVCMTLLVIWPFWSFSRGDAGQTEIPHYSRFPFFSRFRNTEWYEQIGVAFMGVLITTSALLRRRRAWLWMGLAILFLSLLALGDTTPLAEIVFGRRARWLVYEKFHQWATLFATVSIVAVAASLPHRRWLIGTICILLFAAMTYETSSRMKHTFQPQYISDLSAAVRALDIPDAHRYRHITLGMGDQFPRLDRKLRSPNFDGLYFTARTDPALRRSGMGSLDNARIYQQGMTELTRILKRADELSLRWVFAYSEWYYPFLKEHGFSLVSIWENGLTLFERQVPPLPVGSRPTTGFWDVWWGLVPMGLLVALGWMALVGRFARSASDRIPAILLL